jgi:transglutaminase-like putative cysteine protease
MQLPKAQSWVGLDEGSFFRLQWFLGAIQALIAYWALWPLDMNQEAFVWLFSCLILLSLAFPRLQSVYVRMKWFIWPVILIFWLIYDFGHMGLEWIPPLIRLFCILIGARALLPRARREELQLLVLCLIALTFSGVYLLRPLFLLQLLLFIPLGLVQLFLFQVVREYPLATHIPYHWAHFNWGSFQRRLIQAISLSGLSYILALYGLLILFSSVIFMIIPRFDLEGSFGFLNFRSAKNLTGFSDRIELGDVIEIAEDNSIAFRADYTGIDPFRGIPYWRMSLLDVCGEKGFSVSEKNYGEPNQRFDAFTFNFSESAETNIPSRVWTLYYEGGISHYLPAPESIDRIQFQKSQKLNFWTSKRLLTLQETPAGVLFYRVEVSGDELDPIPASADERYLYEQTRNRTDWTQLPEHRNTYPLTLLQYPNDPASQAILKKALGEIRYAANDREGFVLAAIEWLERRHHYSLQTAIPDGPAHIILRWMQSDAPGHCELFAASLVLLCRAEGIPARLITGFKGGEWNAYEQYFMVRNRDAHAWVEYLGEDGWIRTDPTPGAIQTNEKMATVALSEAIVNPSFSAYIDSFRMIWYRRILNFDHAQQVELGVWVKQQLRESGKLLGGLWLEIRDLTRQFYGVLKQKWAASQLWTSLSALLWISVMGCVLWSAGWLYRFFQQKLFGRQKQIERMRLQAGKWRKRLLLNPNCLGMPPAMEVLSQLTCIRYGRASEWPEVRSVFKRARLLHTGKRFKP